MPTPIEIRTEGDRLVALWHGERAGEATIRADGPVARIHVEVGRAHRGLGIGKMLLGAAELRAREAGAREAVVAVREGGFEEHALRKAGWRRRGPDMVFALSAQ